MKYQTEYLVAQFNISKKEIISNERLTEKLDNFTDAFNDLYKEKFNQEAMLSMGFCKANKSVTLSIENEYPMGQICSTFDELIEKDEFYDLKQRLVENREICCC